MRKETEDFIKEVQKEFPNENVNLNNVSDFYIVLCDRDNCKKCKGLNNCPNSNQGFYLSKTKDGFVQVRCKYLTELQKSSHPNLLKSEYNEALSDASTKNYDLNTESRKKILNYITDFAKNYGKGFKEGLYIYGGFSYGKTYSLMLTAKALSAYGIDHIFAYFPDLVIEIKAAMENGKYDQIIELLRETDVLLLDDLGAENMTPWLRDEVLGPIINYRMNLKKPIFVSSNINPNDLKKHFMMNSTEEEKTKAGRITSRLIS
ncbi:MAG: ATP-binding protein [Acholeplasmatales bacterium]|nr:ATP-binding protein [Acholeplasmatales bacterium]